MFRKFMILLFTLVLLLVLFVSAYAISETEELFSIDKRYNMAVSILFDKEVPTVSFVAPDGSVVKGSSLRSDSGDDWIQYYIPKASAGTWMITYDKLLNTKFDVRYSSYIDTISITDFTFSEINGDYLPISFTATSLSDENYHYEVYAVVTDADGNVTGERLLMDGLASVDKTSFLNAYIGDLAAYSNYKLRLDVWQKIDVEETFDSLIANEGFEIAGQSSGEASPDFYTEVNLTDGDILIDWSEAAQWGEYLLAIFDDSVNKSEPFYFTEFIDGDTSTEAIFDTNTKALRIELTFRQYGNNLPTRTKIIPIVDNGTIITTTTGEYTNSSQASIEYNVAKPILADVIVNGKLETINLKDSGSFSVKLPENHNEIEVRYSLDDPLIKYIVKFQFIVDNIPPIIRLPENKSAIRVDATDFVLAGVTEPGAILNVSDIAVPVNADGTFAHTIALKNGENIIKVTASDSAGNITSQDVIINKVSDLSIGPNDKGDFWSSLKKYLPLIISFLVSIVLLVVIFMVSRGFGKARDKQLYIFKTIRNISIVLGGLLICFGGYCLWKYLYLGKLSGGEDYFVHAQESIDKAYNVIQKMDLYEGLLKYIAIGFGVCALVIIAFTLIIKNMKNKKVKTEADSKETIKSEAGQKPNDEPDKPETSTDKPEYICPNCHTKYDKTIKFCGNCGEKML